MYKFLPFEYTFSTRIKTKSERASWFIIFPFFLLLITILNTDANNWLKVLFAFLACMSSYEIGYIYNDNVTTAKEVNPTERTKEFPSNFSFKKAFIGCFVWFLMLSVVSLLTWGGGFTGYLFLSFLITNTPLG